MGHIGDQLRFGTLAFYLLGHRFFKSVPDMGKLFLERLKNPQIFIKLHIQISLCHGINAL